MTIYKNDFPWHLSPGPEAEASGQFPTRNFANKAKALQAQARIKEAFPNEPCGLIHDSARFFDTFGRRYRSRADADAAVDKARHLPTR